MEITGKVTNILPEQTFKNGERVLHQFIIEFSSGNYTKSLCLSVWDAELWGRMKIATGNTYSFGIDPQSHEYNGRWYTDVKCFKAYKVEGGGGSAPQPAAEGYYTDDDMPY